MTVDIDKHFVPSQVKDPNIGFQNEIQKNRSARNALGRK